MNTYRPSSELQRVAEEKERNVVRMDEWLRKRADRITCPAVELARERASRDLGEVLTDYGHDEYLILAIRGVLIHGLRDERPEAQYLLAVLTDLAADV